MTHTLLPRFILLLILTLTGCALPSGTTSSQEDVVVPTMSNSRATTVLPPLTPTPPERIELPPTFTAISAEDASATSVQLGYPAPIAYPTSYPDPVTPSSPTEMPVPLPLVETLPLSSTWFIDADDADWGCGTTLYAHSPDGDIVQLNLPITAHILRPAMPPLLLTCVPKSDMFGDVELAIFDPLTGISVTLAANPTAIVYQWSSGILSPDGRYYIIDGSPSGFGATTDEEKFWGMYRVDLQTGEIVEMLQYEYDMPGFYDQGGASWDGHWPLEWNAEGNGFTVFTLASMDTHLWRFVWDATAAMPYSIDEGTLTVESLDPEAPFPPALGATTVYSEPSLPSHMTQPVLVYRPVP